MEYFINSAEFKLKNPNLSDSDFVRLLDRQVLGREASQGEVDFQVANLTSANSVKSRGSASPTG